jgi:hypothetical protein
MTLTDDIRSQDMWKPILVLLRNPDAQAEAWAFVKARWPELRKKAGARGADQIINGLAALQTREQLEDVRAFFADPANMEPSAKRTLAQTLEFIEIRVRFREANAAPFSAWLNAR